MEWTAQYGVWLYFLVVYLHAMGAPFPAQSGLVAGSLLAASGKINLGPLLAAAFAGSVLGNTTGYTIGRWGGRKLLNRFARFARSKENQIDRFEQLLNQKGIWFIIAARFIIIARQINGLIAGTGHMDFSRFMMANLIGAGLWILVWGLGPYCLHLFF